MHLELWPLNCVMKCRQDLDLSAISVARRAEERQAAFFMYTVAYVPCDHA